MTYPHRICQGAVHIAQEEVSKLNWIYTGKQESKLGQLSAMTTLGKPCLLH